MKKWNVSLHIACPVGLLWHSCDVYAHESVVGVCEDDFQSRSGMSCQTEDDFSDLSLSSLQFHMKLYLSPLLDFYMIQLWLETLSREWISTASSNSELF